MTSELEANASVTFGVSRFLIYNLHANARIDNPIEGKESSLMLLEDLSNDDRGQQVVKTTSTKK